MVADAAQGTHPVPSSRARWNVARPSGDARFDAAISETVRTVRFGEVLATRGVTTLALDDEGRLTR